MELASAEMKIQFYVADQHPELEGSREITGYTDGLLDHLRLRTDLKLSCLASQSSYRPAGRGIRVQMLPFRTDRPVGRLVADQLHPVLGRSKARLWHYPTGFLSRLCRPRVPTLGTVHDTMLEFYAERYPEYRSGAAFGYWRSRLARSLARFDLVLTVSDVSKRSIEACCKRYGISPPPIEVTYQGARWERETPGFETKRDCVVHLCSPLPHKRTDAVLDFWEILQDRSEAPPQLRLIGNTTEQQENRISRLSHVQRFPPLPPAQLRISLESASALVIASEIEAFGAPALEAYYLGTPVLYARGTAVEEILGAQTPGNFQLDSFDSFKAALDQVLDLEAERIRATADQLRQRFSWRACADRTIAAYRTLV